MSADSDFIEAWLETADGRCLPLRGNYRLGRAADNHVIIEGPKASRHHAAIHAQDDAEFWLIDLGSRNGTFRNNHRVLRPTRLRDGDRITVAGASFRFHQPGGSSSGQNTSAAGNATALDFKALNTWLLIVDMESFTQLSQLLPPGISLAVSVGRWIHEGQKLVEKEAGRISKFLGDGFLACWESTGDQTLAVVEAVRGLQALRVEGTIKFRVVVHHGLITFGGPTQFGEEGMIGSELNFIFRLEKLASELGVTYCVSAPARALLTPYLPVEAVDGEHELKGFAGLHRCYRIIWPN